MLESVVSARGKVLRTNFSATSRVTRATKLTQAASRLCLLFIHPRGKWDYSARRKQLGRPWVQDLCQKGGYLLPRPDGSRLPHPPPSLANCGTAETSEIFRAVGVVWQG